VLIAAGAASANFDPRSPGQSLDSNGTALLMGKNGSPVPFDCRFVPAGTYSCDTGGNLLGHDPRFVSYSNFADEMKPSVQAPFKPYFSLPVTKFKGWGVHGSVKFDLSDSINLLYIGSYRAYNSKFGQDQDASPVPIAQLDNELNHHAFSSELRLNFKAMDGKVEGTVGGYYLDQEGIYTARVDLNYVGPVIDFIHGPDTTPSTTKAVFGTVTVHPTEAMSITGGIRYTSDKKDYTYFRSNPDGTIPNPALCFANPPGGSVVAYPNCILSGLYNITGTYKGNRTDYRIVADYRFSPEFLAYASVSTGFKGGGVNPRPFVADQRLSFRPETLTTYEVGFKADILDRKGRLNGAAFLNKYNDIVLTKQVCPESSLTFPCLRPDNIGKANVKGIELEATIRPAPGFTIDGSFSYLDFKYTGPTELAGGIVVNKGSAIPASAITPYTPKTNYSIGAQYDYDTKAGILSFRFDGAYQSAIYTSSENTSWSKIPGRFVGNAQLSFATADKDWKATFEVKNLFNRYYFLSVSDVTTALGAVTGVPAMPRTWALSVKRNF
jgi:iron complex outermembrane receptor protein